MRWSPRSTALAPLLVEAPGYCPPGPKCLFQPAIYQHSRLPGPTYLVLCGLSLKDCPAIKRDGTEPNLLALGRTKRARMFAQEEET